MTKPNDELRGMPDSLCELEASYRGMWDALNRKLPWQTIESWHRSMVSGFKKCRSDLAPTSQWRDINDASHNEHWILACNDELSHSFTAAWSNRHQCFLDWNGDKIKVTQWKSLDAPPTKDLAAAEGEKV